MTISLRGAQVRFSKTVTGNGITSVVPITDGKQRTLSLLIVTPTSGTPNLSISVYDGTTRYYLRKAVAMTAGTPYILDTPVPLDRKEIVEVTSSSASGDMDVIAATILDEGRPGQT